MTKVKICGITNMEDARLALDLGADMLGFNFYIGSPRYISPLKAKGLIEDLPKDALHVGVFVNMEIDRILQHVDLLGLDAVQLHGNETEEFVLSLREHTNAKIIKAFRVGPGFQLIAIRNTGADSILLDAFSQDKYGGTGDRFEWGIAAEAVKLARELFLAGGLTPLNVADAIRRVRPFAVDVASGVESAPGKKDAAKMEAFIRNAKSE